MADSRAVNLVARSNRTAALLRLSRNAGATSSAANSLLEQAATADPEFGEQVRALWRQASTELNAAHGGVINQVSGTVSGNVVQAHDIHGNVTFGDVPRRMPDRFALGARCAS